ncbi:MAG: nucleotidyl transferase AbiEii/AbiGii toxin family protein [Solirubrobacterales bacterium]
MPEFTPAQTAEIFHLAFLDVLSQRLDPARYVLKGGANLRYFFGSLRYSEDIDLDLTKPSPPNLEEKIDRILDSGPLHALLRVADIAVVNCSKPKQTDTTRRWKVGVVEGGSREVRTKIEFSLREADPRRRLDAIPSAVVAAYALRSPSVQHYFGDAPTEQKILALAGRTETQARDVFDLDLLFRRQGTPAAPIDEEVIRLATERALELPFAAYRDQVLPFLEPDAAEPYGSEAAWEQMQAYVAETLEGIR